MNLNIKAKLYKLSHESLVADLFEGQRCLLDKEVLDGVFARDFLKENEIPFEDKGKKYVREYLWTPQGGVTKIKIGYRQGSEFVGAIVYVNYSCLSFEPYVVILDRNRCFDNEDVVADMVARALSWAYKGSEITLKLNRWVPAVGERIYWGYDCVAAHDMGDGASPVYELKAKKSLVHNFVISKQCEEEILAKLHEYIDGKKKPKAVMRPVHAALEAGALHDLTLKLFSLEFGNVMDDSPASFSKYTNMYRRDFTGDKMHDMMVEEFAKIVARHKR